MTHKSGKEGTVFNEKILFSEQGRLLASCRIERQKFYPGQTLEPRL